MSCRYPHYVHYYEMVPRVFEANAEDEDEAKRDLRDEHPGAVIIFVTTDPDARPIGVKRVG